MKKQVKTNAMRILDQANISYQVHTYEHQKEDPIDGVHVAKKLNQNPKQVFKTLITRTLNHHYYVFVLPVEKELDLKLCAKAVNEKSIAMIHVKEINQVSGYIRGGCSPIGMKKVFPTIFDSSCLQYETIYVSGGKIGCQLEVHAQEIITLLHATCIEITK